MEKQKELKEGGKQLITLSTKEPQHLEVERELPPNEIIAKATGMARALKDIVEKTKTSVKIRDESGRENEYLFKEAWETLGKFSGCTAKPTETKPSLEELEKAKKEGKAHNVFWARVEVIRYGEAISAGEAFCCRDEYKISRKTGDKIYPWKDRPDFQLLSMAQTRAISKAFRNCLSWIVVLAGYKPTTAEEMTMGDIKDSKEEKEGVPKETPKEPIPSGDKDKREISPAQINRLYAMMKAAGMRTDQEAKDRLLKYISQKILKPQGEPSISHFSDIKRWVYAVICEEIQEKIDGEKEKKKVEIISKGEKAYKKQEEAYRNAGMLDPEPEPSLEESGYVDLY